MFTDPDGQVAQAVVGAAVNVGMGATIAAAEYAMSGEWNYSWEEAGFDAVTGAVGVGIAAKTAKLSGLARFGTDYAYDTAVGYAGEMVLNKCGKSVTNLQANNQLKRNLIAGNKKNNSTVKVFVDSKKHPEAARHISEAQSNGFPSVLTIDRAGADKRRKESLAPFKTRPGFDRDEYPPAMFAEGGKGASVKYIDPSDNRGAGSKIGNDLITYPNGTKVKILIK